LVSIKLIGFIIYLRNKLKAHAKALAAILGIQRMKNLVLERICAYRKVKDWPVPEAPIANTNNFKQLRIAIFLTW